MVSNNGKNNPFASIIIIRTVTIAHLDEEWKTNLINVIDNKIEHV